MTTKQKVIAATKLRPSYMKRLKKIADQKEMNVSELIRLIVENYIDTH